MLRPAGTQGVRNPAPGAHESGATDAELALRAGRGDRAAFGALYERFLPLVHGVLLAHVPHADVHDLVQDVFVLALRSIASLDEPDRLGPWLVTIARNRAHDHHKRARRETELEPAVLAARAGDTRAVDEAELVLDAIHALPESYRETLVLRLVEGLSGPAIAERTGLTHGSVRVNLFRGMKLLREKLERDSRRTTP